MRANNLREQADETNRRIEAAGTVLRTSSVRQSIYDLEDTCVQDTVHTSGYKSITATSLCYTEALKLRHWAQDTAFAAGKVIFSSRSFELSLRYNVRIDKDFRDIKNHDDDLLYPIHNEFRGNFVRPHLWNITFYEKTALSLLLFSTQSTQTFSGDFFRRDTLIFFWDIPMKNIPELALLPEEPGNPRRSLSLPCGRTRISNFPDDRVRVRTTLAVELSLRAVILCLHKIITVPTTSPNCPKFPWRPPDSVCRYLCNSIKHSSRADPFGYVPGRICYDNSQLYVMLYEPYEIH